MTRTDPWGCLLSILLGVSEGGEFNTVRIVGRHEPDAKVLDDQALFLSFSRSCLKSLFWRSVRPANRTKGSFLVFFSFLNYLLIWLHWVLVAACET